MTKKYGGDDGVVKIQGSCESIILSFDKKLRKVNSRLRKICSPNAALGTINETIPDEYHF